MRSGSGGRAVGEAPALPAPTVFGSRPQVTSEADHGSSTRETETGTGSVSRASAPGRGSSVRKAPATRTRLPHGVGNGEARR